MYVWIYIYICMYMYMYTCMYMYVKISYACRCFHVEIACIHVHAHIHTSVYASEHISKHIYVHIYMFDGPCMIMYGLGLMQKSAKESFASLASHIAFNNVWRLQS